jgi:hypothetical protein
LKACYSKSIANRLGDKGTGNRFTLFDRSPQPLPGGAGREKRFRLDQLKDLDQVQLPIRQRNSKAFVKGGKLFCTVSISLLFSP